MGFKIREINGRPNSSSQKQYILKDPSLIEKLPKFGVRGTQNDQNDTIADEPCAYGSIALVTTGSLTEVYMLTDDNEWTKM